MTHEEIEKNTIFLCLVGSHAYGTNTDTSDEDIGGVVIPKRDHYIGTKYFEQADKWLDANGNKIDKTIFSIDKVVKLLLENNPNILDYLFLPERCIRIIKPEWQQILDIRESFVSKKCRASFEGYAFSQLERIKTHKAYLRGPVPRPYRAEYGLPEKSVFPETQVQLISKISVDYIEPERQEEFHREMSKVLNNEMTFVFRKFIKPELTSIVMEDFKIGQTEYLRTLESISSKYLKEEYLDQARKELSFLSAYKNWKRYESWKKGRNPKRKEIEERCGYDGKHASHLLRLSRMCVEILEGKGIRVDRTGIDAEELVGIRMGYHKFEYVTEIYEECKRKADLLYETSTLKEEPDYDKVESVKMRILEEYLFR